MTCTLARNLRLTPLQLRLLQVLRARPHIATCTLYRMFPADRHMAVGLALRDLRDRDLIRQAATGWTITRTAQ